MKQGNVPINLSIQEEIANAVKGFVVTNRRAGRKTVSELTENLWISYLRRKGVKLPPLLKGARQT